MKNTTNAGIGRMKTMTLDVFIDYLIALSLPFVYIFSIHLFFMLLILLILNHIVNGDNGDESAFIIYLISFVYSGIRVNGIHLYDLILIFVLVYVLFKKRREISIPNLKAIAFLMSVVVTVYFFKPSELAFLEVVRFVLSILTFFVVCNLRIEVDKVLLPIKNIGFLSIYNALVVFWLQNHGLFKNYDGIISSDVFLFFGEVRMNGFFTDPNKYLAFLMVIICLMMLTKFEKITLAILLFGILTSLSRTSFISISVFFTILFLKKTNLLFVKRNRFIVITGCCTAIIVALYVFFESGLVNKVFNLIGELLGRNVTVMQNTLLSEDSRIRIWGYALKLIMSRPIFGYGLDVISDRTIMPMTTHNTFLTLMLEGGVILLVSYISFYKKIFFSFKPEWIAFILVPIIVLDMGTYRGYYLFYAIFLEYIKFQRAL